MTVKQWEKEVKECQESGKTAKAWCREKRISYSTYLRWAKRYRQTLEETTEGKEKECNQESGRQWVNVAAKYKPDDRTEATGGMISTAGEEQNSKLMIIICEGLRSREMTEVMRAVKEACY